MEYVFILILALILDLALGEPPSFLHPVEGIGKIIDFFEKFNPQGASTQLAYGFLIVLLALGIFILPIYFLLSYLEQANSIVFIIVGAFFLNPAFP